MEKLKKRACLGVIFGGSGTLFRSFRRARKLSQIHQIAASFLKKFMSMSDLSVVLLEVSFDDGL